MDGRVDKYISHSETQIGANLLDYGRNLGKSEWTLQTFFFSYSKWNFVICNCFFFLWWITLIHTILWNMLPLLPYSGQALAELGAVVTLPVTKGQVIVDNALTGTHVAVPSYMRSIGSITAKGGRLLVGVGPAIAWPVMAERAGCTKSRSGRTSYHLLHVLSVCFLAEYCWNDSTWRICILQIPLFFYYDDLFVNRTPWKELFLQKNSFSC